MEVNPYEPPARMDLAQREIDPLRLPGIGRFAGSILSLSIAAMIFVGCFLFPSPTNYKHPNLPFDYDPWRPEVEDVVLFLIYAGLCFIVGLCLLYRHHRWLVILAALAVITPCGFFVLTPLGIWILIRLWDKNVWNSFDKSASTELD